MDIAKILEDIKDSEAHDNECFENWITGDLFKINSRLSKLDEAHLILYVTGLNSSIADLRAEIARLKKGEL